MFSWIKDIVLPKLLMCFSRYQPCIINITITITISANIYGVVLYHAVAKHVSCIILFNTTL